MRSWRVWLGFGISLVFLYFAVRGQDFERIGESLREASYIWLVPALIAYFLGVGVRSVRWHFLLKSVQDIPPRRLFPVVTIGFMANNVLPFRAGEVVRAYALSARYGVRKSAALATIAIERVFDGLTMLIFILIASLSIALTSDLQAVAIVATILFSLLTLMLLLFVFVPGLRDWVIDLSVRMLPGRVSTRVEEMAHSFFDGLGILKRRQDLISVGLTSLLAWLLEASMYLLIAEGFNLDVSALAILHGHSSRQSGNADPQLARICRPVRDGSPARPQRRTRYRTRTGPLVRHCRPRCPLLPRHDPGAHLLVAREPLMARGSTDGGSERGVE